MNNGQAVWAGTGGVVGVGIGLGLSKGFGANTGFVIFFSLVGGLAGAFLGNSISPYS